MIGDSVVLGLETNQRSDLPERLEQKGADLGDARTSISDIRRRIFTMWHLWVDRGSPVPTEVFDPAEDPPALGCRGRSSRLLMRFDLTRPPPTIALTCDSRSRRRALSRRRCSRRVVFNATTTERDSLERRRSIDRGQNYVFLGLLSTTQSWLRKDGMCRNMSTGQYVITIARCVNDCWRHRLCVRYVKRFHNGGTGGAGGSWGSVGDVRVRSAELRRS